MKACRISLALAALVELPSYSYSRRLDPAFIHHRVSIKSRPFNNNDPKILPAAKDDESLFEAEEAAAFDAHDVSDAGMEAAAMERAVIMAEELKEHPLEKEKAGKKEKPHDHIVGEVHMLPQEEEDAELLDAEDAAAYDAHDVSDAGMEAAAMERAVIMAEELKEQACSKTKEDDTTGDDQPKKTIFGRILKSIFHHEDDTDSDDDLHLLEANYAHDLSDAAALDHAKEVTFSVHDTEDEDEEDALTAVLEAREAEANYAHDLSDAAALEHAKEVTFSVHDTEDEEDALNAMLEAREAEANYAHDLSDAAALEHARTFEDKEEARIASVEEHYKSIDKDIKTIEHLIQEADKYDHSEGHSLERTFSDDDAADLALMMIEKSIIAATDKLELCQMEAEETENEVKAALEDKYSAKALAESIERDRRAAELRFLSTEHFGGEYDVIERQRDSAIMHANSDILKDALQRERDAELKLEEAIEHDIAAKKELEHMIENKAALKQEFHDLEQIIHEHTTALWEKEEAKKVKKVERHHFDWWHKKW